MTNLELQLLDALQVVLTTIPDQALEDLYFGLVCTEVTSRTAGERQALDNARLEMNRRRVSHLTVDPREVFA